MRCAQIRQRKPPLPHCTPSTLSHVYSNLLNVHSYVKENPHCHACRMCTQTCWMCAQTCWMCTQTCWMCAQTWLKCAETFWMCAQTCWMCAQTCWICTQTWLTCAETCWTCAATAKTAATSLSTTGSIRLTRPLLTSANLMRAISGSEIGTLGGRPRLLCLMWFISFCFYAMPLRQVLKHLWMNKCEWPSLCLQVGYGWYVVSLDENGTHFHDWLVS